MTATTAPPAATAGSRPRHTAIRIGLAVIAAAILAIALSGLGARSGWWHFRTGFTVLRWGAYAALAGAVWTAAAAARAWVVSRRQGGAGHGLVLAGLVGVLVAVVVVTVPWQWRRRASEVPPIHDISTDLTDPPAFVAVLPRRASTGATNPAQYGGPDVAYQQRSAYADIGPLTLPVPPAAAFDRALATARDMGWEIVAADKNAGRIEATDRTFWFGFYDDIVIRVRPSGTGARVDVRSLSRVGGSDVGTNARRIRRYLDRLRAAA